jgi:hypothetical protein
MVTLCRLCHTKWHAGDRDLAARVERHLKTVTNPNWTVITFVIPWQEIIEKVL